MRFIFIFYMHINILIGNMFVNNVLINVAIGPGKNIHSYILQTHALKLKVFSLHVTFYLNTVKIYIYIYMSMTYVICINI